MNAKQIGGGLVWLIAIVLAIGAMSTLAWYTQTYTDDSGNTTTFTAGLKNYKITFQNGGSQSGSLSSLKDDAGYGSLATLLFDGGNNVLEAGIPALFCLVMGLVLYVLYCRRTLGGFTIFAAVASLLAGAVLIVVASLLYAKKLNVGICFIIYLLGALLLLCSLVTHVLTIFGDSENKAKPAAALVLSLGAIALTITALVLVDWFEESMGTGTLYLGVKDYKVTANGASTSGSLTSLKDQQQSSAAADLVQRYIDGGNFALGFGITSSAFALASAVMTGFIIMGKEGSFAALAMGFNFIGLVMLVVGDCLYAKQIYIGYSFIVFTASAFLVLVATALLVSGVFVETTHTTGRFVLRDDVNPSHHARLRDEEAGTA